jgi:D-amino peptidase
MYEEARRLYTEEINAAVRGAKAAGATEIVVMDCHGAGKEWSFNSLVPELLEPDCEFVVQENWTEYTAFLEEGCDAALLVGMHARAGTRAGVMNHTVSGRDYFNLRFNGVLVGETGIHAALCGTWGCPVLLVTGDDAACAEGRELLGEGLTTVAVKTGLGSSSARQIPPVRARTMIEAGAKQALSDLGAVQPWSPGSPCEITVEFKHTLAPDALRFRAGVERVDDRTISVRADTWWDAWKDVLLLGRARALAPVAILEPDDVVEVRRRDLDDQRVLDRRDAMDRARPVAERVAGDDLDRLELAADLPELERRPALLHEPRLVLHLVVLKAQLLARGRRAASDVRVGLGPDELPAPGLLDAPRLDRVPALHREPPRVRG